MVEVMGDEEGHGVGRDAGAVERLARHIGEGTLGLGMQRFGVERVEMAAGVQVLELHAGGVVAARGELAPEALVRRRIAVQHGREHPGRRGGPENDGAGAVAEVRGHRGTARRMVERRRIHLGADDEHASGAPGAYEPVAGREREQEARTLRAKIERADGVAAELVLEKTRRARKGDVRRHGGEDDQVDVARPEPGGAERGERRFPSEVRRADAGLGIVSLVDARHLCHRATRDSELAGERLARHDPRRQEAPTAEDRTHPHGRRL